MTDWERGWAATPSDGAAEAAPEPIAADDAAEQPAGDAPATTEETTPDMTTEEPAASEPTAEDLPYTIGSWGGQKLWKCRYCLHATPDGEYAFYQHLKRHLDTLGEMKDQSSGLVDQNGKPL